MATRKKAGSPEEQPQPPKEAAVKTGIAHPAAAPKKKKGKLPKSNKKRLPRKLKKQQKKKLLASR